MPTYPFNADNHQIYFSAKEATFNVPTNTTTNLAAQTFYPSPVKLRRTPYVTLKKNKVIDYVGNVGPDPGYFGDHGYSEGTITLSGELHDFSLMYFLCKACTTADDTPGAGQYTHTYASTTARTASPPSFALFYKLVNDDSGQTKLRLYTGCVVQSCEISGTEGGMINASFTIAFTKLWEGTALNTYPTAQTTNIFDVGKAVVSYTKATTAYTGKCINFTIRYDDGTYLHKATGEEYPGEALNGRRKVTVTLNWMPHTKNHIDDVITTPLGATAASDLDITIKISRDTSTDYLEFAFEKVWNTEYDDPDWDDRDKLSHKCTFICKSAAYETGAKYTITEVNALDDDRYET